MAGEYIEQPQDVFVYANDWQEVAHDNMPGGGDFTLETQSFSRTGYIPFNKLRSAMRYFLGYANCDTASPFLLHRYNPSPDPQFPWLYCYSFHPVGLAVSPNTANLFPTANLPYVNSPFYQEPDQLRFTNHRSTLVTLGYRALNHRILPDSAIGTPAQEWMRSCFIGNAPRVDVLSADGVGQLIFAANNPGPPVTGPPSVGPAGGTPFPAPLPQPLPKGDYVIDWYGLPFSYLSANVYSFSPTKILNAIATVNSKDFITGDVVPLMPAGTSLVRGAKWEIFPFPVAAANVGEILLGVNIHIMVEHFDPARGVSIGNPGASLRGHNLMPWRGAPGDPTGGMFFPATRGGNLTDPSLLPTFDHNNMFYSVNFPAF